MTFYAEEDMRNGYPVTTVVIQLYVTHHTPTLPPSADRVVSPYLPDFTAHFSQVGPDDQHYLTHVGPPIPRPVKLQMKRQLERYNTMTI